MTRLGKIARLSREIRDELNVRLQNGEVGRKLVEWLNGLPAAQAVLKANFSGKAISAQNLSEWKQGGYEDWVRHQENCAYAAMLTEMSSDLEEEAGETRLEERLAAPMAMALARLLREAEESPAGAKRHRMILDVARQLSQLRREGHQAERVRLERERWEQKELEIARKERQEAKEAAQKEEVWRQVKAEYPALRPLDELEADWKPPRKRRVCSEDKGRVARPHPGPLPQERERTEAAPGKSQKERLRTQAVGDEARPQPKGRARRRGGKAVIRVGQSLTLPGRPEGELTDAAPGESNQIKVNQTKSNQIKPAEVGGVDSGTVVSDQSPEAKEGGGMEAGQSQSEPAKPGGLGDYD